MPNIGESPKDASVSSLSSILEVNVPDGYYLSVRACEGILRRAGERGKPLDPLLKQALLNTIVFMRSKTTPKIAECPSGPITPSKPSPDEWGQGGGNAPLVLVPCFGQDSYDEDVGIANGGASKKSGSIAFSKEVSPTLKASASGGLQAPVVAIPYTLKIRSGCEGGGKGALIQEDKSATLSCNNDQTLFVPTQTENGEVIYLARKLTPTECASLQGFEKDWCALVPHKDSAEYKMWGNGMAYPCVLYIMQGIRGVLTERLLGHIAKDDLLTRHSGENYDDLRQNRGGIT